MTYEELMAEVERRASEAEKFDPEKLFRRIQEANRIARALTLLDRIGDEAADALINGTAAVVPVEATEVMNQRGAPEVGCNAGTFDVDDDWLGHPSDIWRAMLAAGRLDRGGA